MTTATERRVQITDEVSAFLHRLRAMPDDEVVMNPPGLRGVWRAHQLRRGLNTMHAICVHGHGDHLAVTSGPAFDRWLDECMRWDQHGPTTYRDSLANRVTKPLEPPKAKVTHLEDGDRVVAVGGADPWSF